MYLFFFLFKEMRSALATGLQKRSHYSIHEFTVSRYGDGLRHYFPFRQIAECFKSLGIETRQELIDLVSSINNVSVQGAWQNIKEAESDVTEALAAAEVDIKTADKEKESKDIVNVGGILPDLSLLDLKNGESIGLHSVVASSCYTLLVLVRHFG